MPAAQALAQLQSWMTWGMLVSQMGLPGATTDTILHTQLPGGHSTCVVSSAAYQPSRQGEGATRLSPTPALCLQARHWPQQRL